MGLFVLVEAAAPLEKLRGRTCAPEALYLRSKRLN